MRFSLAILFLTVVSLSMIHASDNGVLWECDEAILESDNVCIFTRTDGKASGPHNMDRSIGSVNHLKIVNADGDTKPLSGNPIDVCEIMQESDDEVVDDEWKFVQMWQMVAPIFDMAMFGAQDLTNWETVTKVMQECEIKTDSYLDGKPNEIWYSTDDLKTLMEDPQNTDIHNDVLKYLEESQNELICIMTSTGSWDNFGHCDEFRELRGLDEGESSHCWEAIYDNYPATYYVEIEADVDTEACGVPAISAVAEEDDVEETVEETVEEPVEETVEEDDDEGSNDPPAKPQGGRGGPRLVKQKDVVSQSIKNSKNLKRRE